MTTFPFRGAESAAHVELRHLDSEERQFATLKNLGFVGGFRGSGGKAQSGLAYASRLSVQSEALRVALWALSSEGIESVYITRLVNAARLLVMPVEFERVGQQMEDDSLGELLGDLEDFGDFASLRQGRWLPAPLRYVPLPAIRRWILVGGIPTRSLSADQQAALEYNGLARLFKTDPLELGLHLPVQLMEDWTRLPRQPLTDWARHVLEGAALKAFEDSEATFEYYAPSISLTSLQYHRWIANSSKLPDGRYLARQRVMRGLTSHSIVEVHATKAVATGSVVLADGGDIRRLLYGIDTLAGQQVRVRVTSVGMLWKFELKNELPRAEDRLFAALGHLVLPPGGSYYPRIWEVPAGYATQAARALRRLDIYLDGADYLLNEAGDDSPNDLGNLLAPEGSAQK